MTADERERFAETLDRVLERDELIAEMVQLLWTMNDECDGSWFNQIVAFEQRIKELSC